MDLRTQRTIQSIENAFIELRKEKILEKITVTELAKKACINKATFYLHYRDIYDLSEQLEAKTINAVLNEIDYPDNFISDPKQGYRELASAMLRQDTNVSVLFSGSRQPVLENRLEAALKKRIYERHPDYKYDLKKELLLSVVIHGSFHAFMAYRGKNTDEVVEILGEINEYLLAYNKGNIFA